MEAIGRYFLFIYSMLVNRESLPTYTSRTLDECIALGIEAIPIITLIGIAMGAVTAMQVNTSLNDPLIGKIIIGFSVREMTILELAPTITGLIFAGKLGSNIASQLGSMRITEQIDALEVMGVNSASYLALPKIIAILCMYPLIVIYSAACSLFGGLIACILFDITSTNIYIEGLQFRFNPFMVRYALYKSFAIAFVISTIPCYEGFFTQGGALAVGNASTRAVTKSYIALIAADTIMSDLILSGSL